MKIKITEVEECLDVIKWHKNRIESNIDKIHENDLCRNRVIRSIEYITEYTSLLARFGNENEYREANDILNKMVIKIMMRG